MNPLEYKSIDSQISMFIVDIAPTNYFNPNLNIVRIINPYNETQYLDYKLATTWIPPNPYDHRILLSIKNKKFILLIINLEVQL